MHMHAPHLQLAPSLPARPSCDHPGCGFATRTLRALFSHVREADHAGMLCPLPNCPLRFKHVTTLNDHKVSGAHAGGRPDFVQDLQPHVWDCGRVQGALRAPPVAELGEERLPRKGGGKKSRARAPPYKWGRRAPPARPPPRARPRCRCSCAFGGRCLGLPRGAVSAAPQNYVLEEVVQSKKRAWCARGRSRARERLEDALRAVLLRSRLRAACARWRGRSAGAPRRRRRPRRPARVAARRVGGGALGAAACERGGWGAGCFVA